MSEQLTNREIEVLNALRDGGSWDHDDLILELDAEDDHSEVDAAIISLRERSYLYGGLFHCCISEAGRAIAEEMNIDLDIDPMAMVYAGLGAS